jgi:hypothetical protein
MAKQKIGRNAQTGAFVGVSTSADVRAFRTANTVLTERVTSTRDTARSYVKDLEKRAGISNKKK